MPNSHRELTLLARLRHYIEEVKAQLQQARTKEERDLLNQKIGSLENRQHEERVARRRQAALARRWERMNGPR
jgi:GAF domain-containing protein